tara:strand:+ start:333 stop:1805 length:1473 start_codon:yes stop_codon:yes gene_type:complete
MWKHWLKTVVLVGSIVVLSGCGDKDISREPLVMFCAAGIKIPVARIAEQYEAEYGVPVQIQYGGSGTLLTSLKIADGDVYLAADSSYMELGKADGLIQETMPVAWMKAGLGVPLGNPKGLSQLEEIQNPNLKVGIGNPEAASVGRFSKKILTKHELWDGFEPTVMFPTVNELANALKVSALDVAIIWDAVAYQYPEIDFVSVPEFDVEKKDVTVGVLTSSSQPTEALRFCRYLNAADRGQLIFEEEGFVPVQGDKWVEHPELVLFSGSMLRPAIQESILRFEEREGVSINTVYNGCGILVSQMKAGDDPDAYFSCDKSFMDMVSERFAEPTTVSSNEMVILVEEGNPEAINTLGDLKGEGLKVGFSHPEKSALGALTKKLLEEEGLYQVILDSGNVMPGSATGDFLVNQIRSGALDAVIVYRSNALANASTLDDCDVIGINRPKAIAIQPFAVGQNSDYPNLMSRFLEQCVSGEGKESFLKYGFNWNLEQ